MPFKYCTINHLFCYRFFTFRLGAAQSLPVGWLGCTRAKVLSRSHRGIWLCRRAVRHAPIASKHATECPPTDPRR